MDNFSLKELKSKPTPLLYSSNIVIILTNHPHQSLVYSLCHFCFLPICIIKKFPDRPFSQQYYLYLCKDSKFFAELFSSIVLGFVMQKSLSVDFACLKKSHLR